MTTSLACPAALSEQAVCLLEGRIRAGEIRAGGRLPTVHERLFAAIRAGKPAAARRVATEHLASSAARLGLLGRATRPGG